MFNFKGRGFIISINKIFTLFSSIIISLFVILISFKFTLNFKSLYYFDIKELKIENNIDLTKAQIVETYDYLIDYLNSSDDKEFKMPNLPASNEGIIHFKEVKNIFHKVNICIILLLILAIFSIYICYKKHNFSALNIASNILISLTLLIIIAFSFSFDKSFTIFHQIFFNNDYWIFDYETDPVIKILPQGYFFHCSLLILILIILFSIALKLAYKKFFSK